MYQYMQNLPNWFKIDTPLGTYNPDWVISWKEGDDEKLYFVVESKGSTSEMDLRPKELSKIECGKRHFKELGSEMKVAVTIRDLNFHSSSTAHKEDNLMKYLKINDNKGFYQTGDDNWKEIDSINKEDLMILLDKAIETDFEMNEFIVDNIQNKAHQIIYRNLYEKFSELLDNKTRFKDESEQLYKSAMEKYGTVEIIEEEE